MKLLIGLLLAPVLWAGTWPPIDNLVYKNETNHNANYSWSHTTGSCANRVLFVTNYTQGATVTAMTYGGTPMTEVPGSKYVGTNSRTVQLFKLANPASGANTIAVTISSSTDDTTAMSVTYCGVNQTTPSDVSAGAGQTTSGAPSVTITTGPNYPTVAVFVGFRDENGGAFFSAPSPGWTNYGHDSSAETMGAVELTNGSAVSTAHTATWSTASVSWTAYAFTVVPVDDCAITSTPPLTPGVVGTPYSTTITTANCPSASFSVSAGSLPAGLGPIGSSTGTIAGTPTGPNGVSSFTVSVTSTNGNVSTPLTIAIANAAPVFLTGPTAVGNSATSLKVTYTTDVASSTQIECGTTTGGPYTLLSAQVCLGSGGSNQCGAGGHADGVTTHVKYISQLPTPSFTYFCKALSFQPGGILGTSSEFTGTTTAANTTTQPRIVATHDVRYNDQYLGGNGFANLGYATDQDTRFPFWTPSGPILWTAGDTHGIASGHGSFSGSSHIAITSGTLTTMTSVNTMLAFGAVGTINQDAWTDNFAWTNSKGASVNGTLFLPVSRWDGNVSSSNASWVFSTDSAATWTSFNGNSTCDATHTACMPTSGQALWGGGGPTYTTGFPMLVQRCQDYFTNCTWGDNSDEFMYFLTANGNDTAGYLCRIPWEDMSALIGTTTSCYTGGNGLLAAAWSTTLTSALALTYPVGCNVPVSTSAEWIPDFNGYMFTCPFAGAFFSQYLWGSNGVMPANFLDIPVRNQTSLNYIPGFPNFMPHTYVKLSSSPLRARITMSAVGNARGQWVTVPNLDDYSDHAREYVLSDASLAPSSPAPQLSWNGSRNTHIANGLDCFLDFQPRFPAEVGGNFNDRSPANGCGGYGEFYDQHGGAGYGLWSGTMNPGICDPACVSPVAQTTTTSYTKANTAFTLALVFAHYPNSLAIVANETVLDKGDIQVKRNGSTANSWVVKVGTTTLGAFTLNTDQTANTGTTWPVLFLRWDGTTISVIDKSGNVIETGTYSSTLGTSALTLGTLIGGTQAFYGTIAEMLVWSRALSSSEIAREAVAIAFDMSVRGLSLSSAAGGTVATPTDTPGTGTYSGSQAATLHESTGGATICVTTDGSTPAAATPGTCSNGTTHTDGDVLTAFTVTTTLKTLGTKAGWTNSGVNTSVYTIAINVTFKQSSGFSWIGPALSFTPQSNPSVLCAGSNAPNTLASNLTGISDNVNGSWTQVDSNSATFSSLIVFCVKNTTTSTITITPTGPGSTGIVVGEWASVNASFPGTLGNHSNGQLLAGTAADANTSGSVAGSSGDAIVVFGSNYYGVTTWVASATNPSGITAGAHQNGGTGNTNTGLFYALLSGSYSAAVGANPGTGVTNYTNVVGFQLPH